MKKLTLNDALRVNQKLLDLAEKASGDEKEDIEDARKTFCALIVHLSSGILRMGDAMDKQNDLILKYEEALKLAVHDTVLASDCCGCCPFFYDCEKEDVSINECKEKFMHRWKKKAGLF